MSSSGATTSGVGGAVEGGSSGETEIRTAAAAVATLPTAAILCLAIGAYVMLLVVALLIRRYLKTKESVCGSRGDCGSCCSCCSFLRPPDCSSCCSCPTHLRNCFQQMFASCSNCKEKKFCCDSSFRNVCCVGKPAFDCGRFDCTCSCRLPECSSINCCCFVIHIKT